MRTKLSSKGRIFFAPTIVTAILVLAVLLTFSCGEVDSGGNEPSSSSGTGISSSFNGQSSSDGISSSSSNGNVPSSSSQSEIVYGSPLTYGDETYETIIIGTQTWMARNLNYNVTDSKCYNGDPANCEKYGRLYNWITAMTVCPFGWHIPTNAEWDVLYRYADGTNGTDSPYTSPTAGKYLKSTSGWYSSLCEDSYGFSALPGGYGDSNGYFDNAGFSGFWWSFSEEDNDYYAYNRSMFYYGEVASWNNYPKSFFFSVRCIKD
jgi:uncharacterized protein (TIGR02145 family)